MPAIEENYDVVVVGAGHAGCEAARSCFALSSRYSVRYPMKLLSKHCLNILQK